LVRLWFGLEEFGLRPQTASAGRASASENKLVSTFAGKWRRKKLKRLNSRREMVVAARPQDVGAGERRDWTGSSHPHGREPANGNAAIQRERHPFQGARGNCGRQDRRRLQVDAKRGRKSLKMQGRDAKFALNGV